MSEPWEMQKDKQAGFRLLIQDRTMAARIFGLTDAQADLILRTLNSHDGLLAALEAVVEKEWCTKADAPPEYWDNFELSPPEMTLRKQVSAAITKSRRRDE